MAHAAEAQELEDFRSAARERRRAQAALRRATEEMNAAAQAALEAGATVVQLAAVSGVSERAFYNLVKREQLASERKRAGIASQLGGRPGGPLGELAGRVPPSGVAGAYKRAREFNARLEEQARKAVGHKPTRATREEIALRELDGETIAARGISGTVDPVDELLGSPEDLKEAIRLAAREVDLRRRRGQQAGGRMSRQLRAPRSR